MLEKKLSVHNNKVACGDNVKLYHDDWPFWFLGLSPQSWAPSARWIFVGVMSLIDFYEGLGNRKGGDVMGRPVVVLWISSGRSWCS